jgi:excisionase family DNA binding protein
MAQSGEVTAHESRKPDNDQSIRTPKGDPRWRKVASSEAQETLDPLTNGIEEGPARDGGVFEQPIAAQVHGAKEWEMAEISELYTADTQWLTAEEAACHLKVKTRTLLSWARQKKLRGFVLSGIKRRVWRFRKSDLDTMLLAQDAGVLCSIPPFVLVTKGEGK